MVTNKADAIHFMKIILDWCSPKVARMMMDDLDFYIAEATDNESVRDSIKLIREMVYARAEENLEIHKEEEEFAHKVLTDEMNRQRGMSKE